MSEVVYLTGAPASGKSSLARALRNEVPSLEVFAFGERLTAHVSRLGANHSQENLRSQSASLITPEDVKAVDDELIAFVDFNRARAPVIVDSHAVTKESYGYRVTPYSLRNFERLNPTQIWVLYTSPDVAVQRISTDPQGRPAITEEEARFHTHLQASVTITYSMHLGVPVYFFDSSKELGALLPRLAARLTRL